MSRAAGKTRVRRGGGHGVPRSGPPAAAPTPAAAGARGPLANLLVAVLVPLAFFGALEGCARLLEPGDEATVGLGAGGLSVPAWVAHDPALGAGLTHLDEIPPELDRRAILEFWKFYRPDPDLHYRLRPGLRVRTVNTFLPRRVAERVPWTITSNEDGFRGPRLPAPPRPAGERLLVCLGDSTTYGWGVEEGETFAARLQDYLGAPWRVVNLGHPGYTTFQGLTLLDRVAALRPDAVVVTYGGNDSSTAGLSDRAMWERDHTLPARAARAAQHLAFYRALNRLVLSAWTPGKGGDGSGTLVRRVDVPEYTGNMEEILRRVRGWGGTAILLGNVPLAEYRSAMVKASAATGAVYRHTADIYDLARPELTTRRAYAAELAALEQRVGPLEQAPPFIYTNADPGHPSAIGHDLIARRLAALVLAGSGRTPPPPWRP